MSHSHLLLKNGLLVMILGLFGGFGLVFSMMQAISFSPLPIIIDYAFPGSPEGWRMFHLGMLLNGLMAVVVGLALRSFDLTPATSTVATWGTLIAIWGNFCFYLFGMFAPNHGLSLQGNRLGEASLAGTLAFVPAFIGALTLIVALFALLKSRPLPPPR